VTFEFREPRREDAPLLIGISGGSGAGKTFTSCLLARGLAGGDPFALIDTENGRALHYADFFPDMRHTHLREPYSPARYAEAIKAADEQGFNVIVVDSASHEYEGEGGVLRIQEQEFERLGSRDSAKMLSWIKPKTEHKAYVRQLLQTRAHVILAMRAEDKIEVVDDPEKPGKKKVIAKPSLIGADGWIPIMEKRLPFEMTVHLLLTPDVPGVPKPIKLQEQHKPFVPLDRPLDEAVGKQLGEWASGAALAVAHSPSGLSMPKLLAWIGEAGADKDKLAEIAKRLFPNGTGFKSLTDEQRLAVRDAYVEELAHV